MFNTILSGELPNVVFKRVFKENPSLDKYEIAGLLTDEFPKLDSLARQVVWGWKRPGRDQGLSDENFDTTLLKLFKEAGYL